jgi:uncharacterized protein (TIGR02996 family)
VSAPAELIEAIRDAGPDEDDAARLVYADWLSAQGDELGALIAAEHALAAAPSEEREAQRNKLWSAARARYDEMRALGVWCERDRGVIVEISMTTNELLAVDPRAFDLEPIRRAVVDPRDDDLRRLAAWRCLPRIRSLLLGPWGPNLELFDELFSAPHKLRELEVVASKGLQPVCEALAKNGRGLRSLSLSALDDRGVETLAAAQLSLQSFSVKTPTSGHAMRLVQALAPRAAHLSIESEDFAPEGIAASPCLATVEKLVLKGKLGEAGARALAASPHLGALRSLHLWFGKLDDAGVAALAPLLPRLECLQLETESIAEGAMRTLVSTLRPTARLLASRSIASLEAMLVLGHSPLAASLTEIDIRAGVYTKPEVDALVACPHLQRWPRLRLLATGNFTMSSDEECALSNRFAIPYRFFPVAQGYGPTDSDP